MRALLLFTAFSFLFISSVFASPPPYCYTENDGSPNYCLKKIEFPNGSLSLNGNNARYTASGGGTPGGNTTEIQYNDAGAFNGATAITYTKATGLTTFTQQATGTRAVTFKGKASTSVPIIDVTDSDGTQVFTVEARSATSGANNTFAGLDAATNGVTGAYNSVYGVNAANQMGGADDNTILGGLAGYLVTTGSHNTFVGYTAGRNHTTTSDSACVGEGACFSNGASGSCVGINCLYNATGGQNSAIGYFSLTNISTGASNMGVGTNSGATVTTGSDNTFIGYAADGSAAARSGSIALGRAASATADKQMAIGSATYPIESAYFTGTAPSLSSCGTTPSITGNDMAGKVTIGTNGGGVTSCTVSFAVTWATNAPACVISGDNTLVTYIATTSTTAMTITSSLDMQSDVISYQCLGYK